MNTTILICTFLFFLVIYEFFIKFSFKKGTKYLASDMYKSSVLKPHTVRFFVRSVPVISSLVLGYIIFVIIYSYIGINPSIIVMGIKKNLPAAQAGLKMGDRIIDIKGLPSKNFQLKQKPKQIDIKYKEYNSDTIKTTVINPVYLKETNCQVS